MKLPQHTLQIASPGTDRRVRNATIILSSYFVKALDRNELGKKNGGVDTLQVNIDKEYLI